MVQIVPRLGPIPFPRSAQQPATVVSSSQPARPAGMYRGDGSATTDIGGLLQILRRNLKKIILSTLAGLALSIAYLAIAKPVYTATASIFVDPRTRKVVSDELSQGDPTAALALVESQMSIITSDSVLGRVVKTRQLDKDPDYATPRGSGLIWKIKGALGMAMPPSETSGENRAFVQAVQTLSETIKVKRAQKTYVIDVEVSAATPEGAQKNAKALADAYLDDQRDAKSAQAKEANMLIDGRLKQLREQVSRAEAQVDSFKKDKDILTSEGGIVNEQQLSKLNGELITARAVAAESKARRDQIQSALKTGPGAEMLPDAVRSGLIQRLREQYAQVARREAALSSQLQPRHPVLVEVRSQLAEVKTQISAELKRVAIAAQAEYEIASNRERDISAQLDKAKKEVARTNTDQIELRSREQEANASRELLRQFLARAKETQEQQNTSIADARIISEPTTPTKPAKPIAWLILALGLMGGLGLGLASALVGDHFDSTVRRPQDFAPHLAAQTITAIPTLQSARSRGLHAPHWPGSAPPERVEAAQFSDLLSALSDHRNMTYSAYRQSVLRLLTRIKTHQRPGQPHTVMLASPGLDAGNSATALALAYAAAQAGERVLLVDATSSDPALSTVFATSLAPKNVIVLDNKDDLARITTRDARTDLTFLPIALADLRTLKLQQRRRLVAGLSGLIQRYDLVFIDAGAVLDDESANCLLPVADQVLIVARCGSTSRSQISRTLEALEPSGVAVTGGVLAMAESA